MSPEALNDEQRAAVECEGHALVSACPGSGKTRVLIARAEHLLRQNTTHQVLAVTFSREAAQEMATRMNARGLPPAQRRRFDAGTFHALALQQLTRAGKVQANRILQNAEWITLLKTAIEKAIAAGALNADTPYEDISLAVQGLQVEEAEPDPNAGTDAPMAYLYRIFHDLKQESGKLDFADILRTALQLMQTDALAPLPCTHLLVDEAQDMDALQYAWLREISRPRQGRPGPRVTLVGDDDQGIYEWRHAQGYRGMIRFRTEFAAADIRLPVNYRCAPEILVPASHLIQHNQNRVSKNIRAVQPSGGKAEYRIVTSAESELDILRDWHFNAPEKETIGYIARTNAGLNDIELALRAAGIGFARSGGGSFLDEPSVAAMHRLLLAVALHESQPRVALSHLRFVLLWAQVPYSWIRTLFHAHDNAVAIASAVPPLAELQQQGLPSRAIRMLDWARMNFVLSTQHARRPERTPLLVKYTALLIFDAFHNRRFDTERMQMVREAKNPQQPDGREEDLKREQMRLEQFAKILTRAVQSSPNTKKPAAAPTLLRTLQRLEAETSRNASAPERAPPRITLLTAHASKGREFDRVLLSKAEADVFPSAKNLNLEEERRLMYVAMTRARHTLLITSRADKSRSPFLEEAGLAMRA